MRITFANEATARAAASILGQYGYTAKLAGTILVTDCPAMLAVPVVGRTIGLDQVEAVHVASGPSSRAGTGQDSSPAPA